MAKKRIKFVRGQWLPVTSDSDSLSFQYQIEDLEVASATDSDDFSDGVVTVNISRTLSSIWGLEGDNLVQALAYYAKEHIAGKAEELSLTPNEELLLSTYNSPNEPPFDKDYSGYLLPLEFEVEVPVLNEERNLNSIEHAGKIVDIRDSINAIFGEAYESKLLSLTQERALFELSRTCSSREEFSHRVASLCHLAISIDSGAFKKFPEIASEGRSIEKLGKFLRAEYPGENTEFIMERIAQFNHLRRLYPIHTDRTSGVLPALKYFGIEYPVEDFQSSWNILLESYIEMLEKLIDILRPK